VIDPGAPVLFEEGRIRHLLCPVDDTSDGAPTEGAAGPTGSDGSACRLCGKPLDQIGETWFVDRAGDHYHVACWCRMVTIKAAEIRERGEAIRRWVAEVREEATRRLEWTTRDLGGTPPSNTRP
jgi:hypothetical protein